MNRRRFLKSASGLFVPIAFGLLTRRAFAQQSWFNAVAANQVAPAAGTNSDGSNGDTKFITGQTLGAVLSTFTGWVGMRVVCGAAGITITTLGRWVKSGNSQSHLLEVVEGQTKAILGSVSVDTAGATAGQFQYAVLSSPISIIADESFFVMTPETSGGDQLYDHTTSVTATAVATVTAAYYTTDNSTFNSAATGTVCDGPVTFQYHLT